LLLQKQIIMARIAGITIEKDKSGNARYARIDLKKYGKQLSAFFQELGIQDEVSTYDPKFVAKIKRSEKQAEEGKVQRLDLNDIWK
jgi:hypothetical protein